MIEARKKMDTLAEFFKRQCVLSGYTDEWDAYRRHDAGEKWPDALELSWQWYIAATYEFYALRDGPKGFLGKYGI